MPARQNQREGKILLVDDDPGLLRLLSIRLRAEGYEIEAVDSAIKALATAIDNKSARRKLTIHIVSNGVDTDYFHVDRQESNPPSIVFVGKMSYHANVSAAVHLICKQVNGPMTRRWPCAWLRA